MPPVPIVAAGLVLWATLSLETRMNEAGAEPGIVRTDLYGDSLPTGAIARVGSVRLKHAGLSELGFLPDNRTLVSSGTDGQVRYWDLTTGKQLRAVRLLNYPKQVDQHTMSENDLILAALS